MRFLADESCDFAVVRALRAEGHDVEAVAEVAPRLADREVITRAVGERRILLTEDKDFGRLVFASAAESAGVIFMRYPATARDRLGREVVQLVREHGPVLAGAFTVVEPGRARIKPAR